MKEIQGIVGKEKEKEVYIYSYISKLEKQVGGEMPQKTCQDMDMENLCSRKMLNSQNQLQNQQVAVAVVEYQKIPVHSAILYIEGENSNASNMPKEGKGIKIANPTPAPDTKGKEKEYPEVDNFLASINMLKYKEIFLSNGFEDLESILELQEEHFATMRIPLGHKLKILKKIKELKPPEVKPQIVDPQPLHGIQKKEELVPIAPEKPVEDETGANKGSSSKKKSVRFEESPKVIEEKLQNITPPKPTEKKSSPIACETQSALVINSGGEAKDCCWNCFKLYNKGSGYSDQANKKVLYILF